MFQPEEEFSERELHREFTYWLAQYDDVRSHELISVLKSLILQMRQVFTTEQLAFLTGHSILSIEQWLIDNEYVIEDIQTGGHVPFVTAEQRQRARDLADAMSGDIPDDLSGLFPDEEADDG